MYEDDEKTINKIKESLDFLDDSIEIKAPDLNHFIKLVSKVEKKKQEGKNLQFIIFIITAAVVISIETYSFYKSFIFFIILQAVALICILPAIVNVIVKKLRQVTE